MRRVTYSFNFIIDQSKCTLIAFLFRFSFVGFTEFSVTIQEKKKKSNRISSSRALVEMKEKIYRATSE